MKLITQVVYLPFEEVHLRWKEPRNGAEVQVRLDDGMVPGQNSVKQHGLRDLQLPLQLHHP